jgi:1-acyl-sn-glycerol-3-phosphate acyltransferase
MAEFMRGLTRLLLTLLARITVTGLENVPPKGPLLILANHVSTIDGPLLIAFLPIENSRFVGPGDFKLLFPANLFVKWFGVISIKRSNQLERASLKEMTEVLKSGGVLSLFPEGGTWEKPITEAKQGAAYLSMTTNTPVLPVALGGTYRVWYKIARLQRPKITINIGKVIPPIQTPADKSKREEVLTNSTKEVMTQIYNMLPAADRAWYDDLGRRRYDVTVQLWRNRAPETVNIPGQAVLGEIMVKPNLMSPLVHNAGLPLDPFQFHRTKFPTEAVHLAAKSLLEAME